MAFFSSKEKNKSNKPAVEQNNAPKPQPKTNLATIISKGIRVAGNITGSDFVQVEGVLDGDITVDNVTIGASGVVNGTIKAKNVAIEGELKGEIYCSDLEVKKQGKVSHKIYAVHLLVSGNVTGDIVTEKTVTIEREGTVQAQRIQSKKVVINGSVDGKVNAEDIIEVGHDGKVKTDRLESKKITVNGKIEGKLTASELLEVGKNGFVQGEITVKNIKTEEGGRVIGTMVTYEETVKQIENNNDDIIDTETA
ncbi:MAG: polymer-forming cytoskeletal protein [Epsilonproteobacteria bacterium]|nr:polymer-forming cytoskeletal protein [Campylobacterota bacterium]